MVVESFINYLQAEKRPDEMIFFGFIITTIAILLAMWVFPSYASFAMVTFTVMAVLPLMIYIMRFEKEKQEKARTLRLFIHKRAVLFFVFLFLGISLAFTTWFLILPMDAANNLFFLQINTITEINSPTGAAVLTQGMFSTILANNARILAFSILFSFVFGAGAIFILVWNASVLGAAMASAVKIAVAANGSGAASYFGAFSFSLVRFLVHGIPEVTAYFIGGLAGGILSFTILDYKFGGKALLKKLYISLKDSSALIAAAVLLLVVAALIEVFIVPALLIH